MSTSGKRRAQTSEPEGDSGGAPASARKRSKSGAESEILIKESYSGRVNTIRSARFGAPGSGIKSTISYFKCTLISSQDELEVFCDKIKRHGHSRVKGPAGRVPMESPLAEACEAESIDFDGGDAVLLAVWSKRLREPRIECVHSEEGTVTVELCSNGVDRGAVQRSSSVNYGSYAAAVVPWKSAKEPNLKFEGDTNGLLLD